MQFTEYKPQEWGYKGALIYSEEGAWRKIKGRGHKRSGTPKGGWGAQKWFLPIAY